MNYGRRLDQIDTLTNAWGHRPWQAKFAEPGHYNMSKKDFSRVDDWRGGTALRFQPPLIEPDVRISRIRLSDKASCLRPRKTLCPHFQPGQPQGLVKVLVGIACGPSSRLFVLAT